MKKRTIILTQEQINEICGENFAFDYLDGSEAEIYGNEASAEGAGVDGEYPENLDTDTSASEKSAEFLRSIMPRGRDVSTVYEMTKKDFEKKKLYSEAKAHGNKRLKNRKFVDPVTKQDYNSNELTQQAYRDREAIKNLRSNDPNAQKKGLKYFNKTAKNRQKDGKNAAMRQFNAAKRSDKIIQQGSGREPNKPSTKNYGNGKAHTPKNGFITMV